MATPHSFDSDWKPDHHIYDATTSGLLIECQAGLVLTVKGR